MTRIYSLILICLACSSVNAQTAPEPFCATESVPENPYDAATTSAFIAGLPDVVRIPVLFLVARDGDAACDDFDCDSLIAETDYAI